MERQEQIHGSAIAVGERGCLIMGRPGSGKSRLVIETIALGARLVADDRVDLTLDVDKVLMSAPVRLRGLVEARGVGILRLAEAIDAPASLIVDMDSAEQDRLPERRTRDLLGLPCPVMFGKGLVGLPAILMVTLSGSIIDPDCTMVS